MIELVAAVALGLLALAGIGFLVAHALADYRSKSEVSQRILDKYMIDNKLKMPPPPPSPNQPR